MTRKATAKAKQIAFVRICEGLIRDGKIDSKGKSPVQVAEEFWKYVHENFTLDQPKLLIVFDYTEELLSEARRYLRLKKYGLACMLYATWYEHRANSMLATLGRRARLSQAQITDMIRGTSPIGKLTWIPRLLGVKPVSERYVKSIRDLMELRNRFAHYKWTGIPEGEVEHHTDPFESHAVATEKLVKYLARYEQRNIVGISGRRLKRMVAGHAQSRPNHGIQPTRKKTHAADA